MRKLGMGLLWTVLVLVVLVGIGLLMLNRPNVPYETLEKRYATAQSRYADLPGGVRVHYEDAGDPTKPTVVLLHGYGDSFLSWRPLINELSQRYRVIAPDLPGHGLTRAPADFGATTDNYVVVMDQFTSRLGLKPFTLAGNSLGGGVAWQFAVAHPGKLNGLVLVDAAGWPSQTLQKPPLAFRILMSKPGRWYLQHFETRPITSAALKADFHNPALVTPDFFNRWVDVQLAPGHRPILMSLHPGANSVASKEVLSKLTVPTLILHGADDHIIAPVSAEKFHDAIPGSQLIVYPATGHLPQLEQTDRVAADLSAFVDKVNGSGAGHAAAPQAGASAPSR